MYVIVRSFTDSMYSGKAKEIVGEAVWEACGMSGVWNEKKNDELFYQMDINQDGKINMSEFTHHFQPALPADTTEFEVAVQVL